MFEQVIEAGRADDGLKLVAAVESLRLELGKSCLDHNSPRLARGGVGPRGGGVANLFTRSDLRECCTMGRLDIRIVQD